MRRPVSIALVSYACMGGVALVWAAWQGRPIHLHPQSQGPSSELHAHVLGLCSGAAIAVLGAWSTGLLLRTTRWASRLMDSLVAVLGPLSPAQSAILAASSGIGEELLFRGAMQPAWGLLPATLIFGLLHVGPERLWGPWSVWATVMGAIFGALFQWTGSLLAPIIAHGLLNYLNLRLLARVAGRKRTGSRR